MTAKRSVTRYRGRERGSLFLLALTALTVLLMLGASLMEKAQTALHRATQENRSTRSFHLAEGGIHAALHGLNEPNGWLTYTGESNMAMAGGFFDVAVAPAPSTRGVLTDRLTLVATGYLPGPNGAQRNPCTIRVLTHKDPRYFSYAVFGSDKVRVGNGTVTVMADSYSSDDGAYGGSNVAESADIGTNSTAANAVEILPQGEVHGNVTVGAGACVPSACVDNQGTITGDITALDVPVLLPSVGSIPAGVTELGDVWLDTTDELVLGAGAYHMTDLDIFGNAQITCNGKVVIYIDQASDAATPDIRIGGNGIVNTSQIPANLVLYCCDDVVSITIGGNGTLYGGIYAPRAHVVLNSGEVYGSVVAHTVAMNGATAHLHYDEALRDHASPHAVVRSWEVL